MYQKDTGCQRKAMTDLSFCFPASDLMSVKGVEIEVYIAGE
jgi:hypothetical protein